MSARYFNWKLAIVLVISVAVLAVGAFSLRQWRKADRAERGLRLGNKAIEEHKWADAAKYLGEYLAVEQTDISVLLKYADAQLKIRPAKRSYVQQAIGAYRTVLRLDEDNSEAAAQLTEIYLGIGSFGEAELIAGRYIAVKPDPKLHRMLALAMIGQRKFQEAATELKAIVQKHPEQIPAYEVLGQLVERRPEEFEEAPAGVFDQAVKNNPSSALAYIARAGFYRRSTNDAPAVLVDLQRAERQDLSDPEIRLRLARELITMGQLDRAAEHLEIVQEADPKNQDLWQAWARLALKSGSQEKMLEVAEAGLAELVSQPWDFMPMAAELFILAGRLEDANNCISELRLKDIGRAKVAFLSGLVASEQGDLSEAVRHWKQSIESGNRSPRVRLALASALSRSGDRQSAKMQLRDVVSENPGYLEGRLALARLLAQAGDWAGTLEHAAAAARLSPENSSARLLRLRAQMQLLKEGASDQGQTGAPTWRDLRKELLALAQKGEMTADVKLVQLQLAIRREKYAEAESLVGELEGAGLSKRKVALAKAELLAAQGNPDQAILKLYAIIEEFPDDFEAVSYAAVLLARQGDREKCEQVIQDAMARIDEPVTLRKLGLTLAQYYTSWDRKDDAYRFLVELEGKLPDDIPVKRRLLLCEQTVENPEMAQRLIDGIKLLEGEGGWQWRYEQAKIWFAAEDFNDRYARVVSILQENVVANPDDQASRVLMARAYERVGASKLAISTFREALNRSPDDLRVIIPAVAALYNAKEYEQAEQILTRASEQKLSHPLLNELRLQDHLRRGHLDQASGMLQEILSNDPENQRVHLSLALLKMQQQEYEEASLLLGRLKEQDPNSLPVTAAQIQLSFRKQEPAEALRLSDEIVNRVGDSSAYILRARTYASLGQFEEAGADLDHAVSTEPENVEVWVARSDFFRSRGLQALAVADIKQAISLASDDSDVRKRAISLFLASEDPALVGHGRAILQEALEAEAEDVDLLLYKARSLLLDGTGSAVESAEQILETITEEWPERSDAWVLLGEIAIKQGQSDKAMNAALGGLAHRPTDKALLLLKARAEAARSPVLAIPTLEVLHNLNPDDVRAALLLANTYTRAGEPKRAMTLLRKQLQNDKTPSRRLYEIAMAAALYRNGTKQKAEKEFQLLLQAEPNDPTPLFEYVRLLKEDRQWDRVSRKVINWFRDHTDGSNTAVSIAGGLLAIDDSQASKAAEDILRTVLRDDPKCTPAMRALAVMLQTTGRTAEAAVLYERLLAIEPNHLIAINNLAWIMCEDQGKYSEALELAQRGLDIAPDYFDLVDTRGVIYYRLGKFDKAAQDFTKCVDNGPSETPAGVATRFYLARTLVELGENRRAIAQLDQALDLQSRLGGLSS
ncbi:MAG TPA: tetratricopeptide repeat protein, partial [Phycisphaerales bacterium]|nr:tetratricopeptide repeat protein [Phycisphaerales bacterium]